MRKIVLFISLSISLTNICLAQSSCPCCQPEHRQFDFWLGEWEVYNPEGKLVGTNHIKMMQDSCVIQENWQSGQSPYSGTSYNFYNQINGKWQQLWIDNQGKHLELTGGLEGANMVLIGSRRKVREGKEYINRITWSPLPEQNVRQHWEISYDDGETWKTIFDGEYRKKSELK